MLAEHNAVGIELWGCFKGHAEWPLGIGALIFIFIFALILIWSRRP
jgi:hypothetical protein